METRNLRLLIQLFAENAFPYDQGYHHNLQGFIYRLIKRTGYNDLHDREGCKFFSFSNIIPPTRTTQSGSMRSLVVASPNKNLIETMQREVETLEGTVIKIGRMSFRLEDSRLFDMRIPEGFQDCNLISGTPIIVRIQKHRLPEYGITPTRNYDYVYWRKEYTPTALIKQLEENLIKKYAEYYNAEIEPPPIFENLRFKKQVAIPLQMNRKKTTIIGTLWEFNFKPLNGLKRHILQFGLDAGFGEMNSLGFGFMNLIDERIRTDSSNLSVS